MSSSSAACRSEILLKANLRSECFCSKSASRSSTLLSYCAQNQEHLFYIVMSAIIVIFLYWQIQSNENKRVIDLNYYLLLQSSCYTPIVNALVNKIERFHFRSTFWTKKMQKNYSHFLSINIHCICLHFRKKVRVIPLYDYFAVWPSCSPIPPFHNPSPPFQNHPHPTHNHQ